MSYREADVRDSLAVNLDLIEPGLEKIDTELHLKNSHGAKGFIDIFARDRLRNVVVIEVKREDQSARQAIQEILKYAELLQREKGYPMHRIRLVIASTHWHELRVPFSALARFCPYPLLGIDLTVDADGTVTCASAVEGLPLSAPGEIAVEHIAFVWKEREGRDGAWKLIAPALSGVGLDDSLGIELDYQATAHRPHPFALLFVPGRIPAERAVAVGLLGAGEIAPGVPLDDLEDDEDPGDLGSVEGAALYRLLEEVKGLPNARSVVHPMSPEKLIAERQQGWVVSRVHRAGVFAAASERSDEELVAAVEARDGLNQVVFDVAVNSGHRLAWEEAIIRAGAVLEGNDDWQTGLATWLTERESEEPRDYQPTALVPPV